MNATYKSSLIKFLRKKNKKSKQGVINDLLKKHDFHVSRPTWDSWENGEVAPNGKVLAVLANYFGIRPSEFFV